MLKPTKNDHFQVFLTVWVISPSFLTGEHAFLCPMDFNLLCERGRQGGVLNPTKNDQFQAFLAVWALFPKFLGRLRVVYYRTVKIHESLTCICVSNYVSFVL